MTILIKTESTVQRNVWVADAGLSRRPTSANPWGGESFGDEQSHSSSSANSASSSNPNRPGNHDNPPNQDYIRLVRVGRYTFAVSGSMQNWTLIIW